MHLFVSLILIYQFIYYCMFISYFIIIRCIMNLPIAVIVIITVSVITVSVVIKYY